MRLLSNDNAPVFRQPICGGHRRRSSSIIDAHNVSVIVAAAVEVINISYVEHHRGTTDPRKIDLMSQLIRDTLSSRRSLLADRQLRRSPLRDAD